MLKNTNKFKQALETLEITLKELKIFEYFFDNDVTEILVNSNNSIFIKKSGVGFVNTKNFASPEKTLHIIQILASLEGLIVNSSNPKISTTLPMKDLENPNSIKNYRFEGVVPPVVENPIFNIRKPSPKLLTLDDYVKQGAFTNREAELLKLYIKNHKNILIIGATDTGKTTLINALVREMEKERIVFIEEVRELQVDESKIDNASFLQVIKGCYEPKDAIATAVRMNPDRIIYGEVRGIEAFSFLMAANTGHSGICSIHSNDCSSGLEQLEIYILLEKERINQKFIAGTIDVLINMKSINNKRVLAAIAETKGYENGEYILDFKYKREEGQYE